MGKYAVLALVWTFSACGGEESPRPPDLAIASLCGWPDVPGNSLGIGKFCEAFSDCRGNGAAVLCTSIADPQRFFCTFQCQGDGGAAFCGEAAKCTCSAEGQCACVPDRCLK